MSGFHDPACYYTYRSLLCLRFEKSLDQRGSRTIISIVTGYLIIVVTIYQYQGTTAVAWGYIRESNGTILVQSDQLVHYHQIGTYFDRTLSPIRIHVSVLE